MRSRVDLCRGKTGAVSRPWSKVLIARHYHRLRARRTASAVGLSLLPWQSARALLASLLGSLSGTVESPEGKPVQVRHGAAAVTV